MSLRRVLAVLALSSLSLAGCGSDGDSAPARVSPGANPFTDDTTWIAYQSSRNGPDRVFLIHPDGSDDHELDTGFNGDSLLPAWSPDGSKLIFETHGGVAEALYEYDFAKDSSVQLFDCERPCIGDGEAAYSPDGTKVVFVRFQSPMVFSSVVGEQVPDKCGLWVGDVATGEVHELTINAEEPCVTRELSPRWSPDGSQIAYFRERYEDSGVTDAVFVVDADGTNELQLTEWDVVAGYPDWSPDGEWIVFATRPLFSFNFDAVVSDLYRMRPDGSAVEQLTFFDSPDTRANQPRYTPDGEWIVFTAVTEEGRSLWAIPAAGGDPVVIVAGGIYTHPTWQPSA